MKIKLDKRLRSAQRITLVALVFALLAAIPAAAQAEGSDGFAIQVFALSGPTCPVVILGEECPDALLPGIELVLEWFNREHREFEQVTRFKTNANGYADLFVKRRGAYRVDVPNDRSLGLRAAGPPFFLGPVRFRVPARHIAEDGFRLTPVVVNFDSGIR
jgi:hypothetical protein